MKTFKDLQFKPHSIYNGLQATINFDNHYGVRVVEFYEYYGVNSNLWEVAILYKDTLTYNTSIKAKNCVIGGLTEQDVTYVMKKVQVLPDHKFKRMGYGTIFP